MRVGIGEERRSVSASVNKVSENWMQKTGEEQSETAVERRSESGQYILSVYRIRQILVDTFK